MDPQEGGTREARVLRSKTTEKHFAMQNANDTEQKVSAKKDAEHPQKLTVPRSGIQGVMRGSANVRCCKQIVP